MLKTKATNLKIKSNDKTEVHYSPIDELKKRENLEFQNEKYPLVYLIGLAQSMHPGILVNQSINQTPASALHGQKPSINQSINQTTASVIYVQRLSINQSIMESSHIISIEKFFGLWFQALAFVVFFRTLTSSWRRPFPRSWITGSRASPWKPLWPRMD